MTSKETELTIQLRAARAETRSAFENRALMYAYILDELEEELGLERAAEVMRRAILRRGTDAGPRYSEAAQKHDLDEVGRLFVAGSPSHGALFEPAVDSLDQAEGRVVLRMTACPLVDAWRNLGIAPERVDLLCQIASAVDQGTFEAAGFDLEFLDRRGCPGSDRCLLDVRLRNGG